MKKVLKVVKKLIPLILVIFVMWFFFIRQKGNTAVVKKIELQNRIVERTVSASGSVKSINQVNLTFRTIGKVQSISVEVGDKVSQGQLLSYLDASSQVQTVQSSKDARDIILRNIDLLKVDPEGQKDTLGGETEYEITLRKYNEQLSQAEASYQAQKSLLSSYYIYAPFEGTVLDVSKEVGETATAGETIIKLADIDKKIFEIDVDQEDYGYVEEGMAVEIELDTYPNKVFTGTVGKLPLFADENTDNFTLEINLDENADIKIGMTGDAYIVLSRTETEVPSLSLGEIFYDNQDKPYVWVSKDNMLEKRYVEIGLEGDIDTEVKTSFEENETLVIPANNKVDVEEGFKVKINGK